MLVSIAMNWRMTSGIGAAILFTTLAIAALMKDFATDDAGTDPIARPHVVFIVIDTLRLDHTSLVGYHRDTTPGLKRLAAQGLEFENHFSNAPWTKASVATILTGLLPGAHGSQWGQHTLASTRKVDTLSDGFVTLPEVLRQHGYRTHGFMTNPTLTASLGYGQGFDEYLPITATLRGDQQAVQRTKRTLNHAQGPTFVWCHLMAVHNYVLPNRQKKFVSTKKTPINKDAHFGAQFMKKHGPMSHEQAIDRYDGTVVFVDRLVQQLTAFIREKHPNTLIIITSDHGEEFFEHGGYLHARTLYNELLRVPLVLVGPAIPSGGSVTRLTDHADLFSTVLDYIGLPPLPTQGESILREPAGRPTPIYAEKRNGSFAQRALITEEGKFMERKPRGKPRTKPSMEGKGTWEFYRDPTGLDDRNALAALAPGKIAEARASFERIAAENQRILLERTQGGEIQREMTSEELEALRALGYAE